MLDQSSENRRWFQPRDGSRATATTHSARRSTDRASPVAGVQVRRRRVAPTVDQDIAAQGLQRLQQASSPL